MPRCVHWRTDGGRRRGYKDRVLAIDPRCSPTRRVRSLADAHDRIGPSAPGPAIGDLRRARARARALAPAVRSPVTRPTHPGVAIGDWELLFDAAMARLHGLVDSIPRRAPPGRVSPGTTGSLHDDLLDCAAALDQLHASITHERALCHQRAAALFDDTPATGAAAPLACGRVGAACATVGTAALAPCQDCAAHPPPA